jgi:endonuclease/exonuclease/phosphatase family metal-dependent hydrolase
LILSRWPIRDVHFTRYDLAGLPQRIQHADWYGGKGFARCVLDTPAGEFSLFNTHLHAGYGRVGAADEYFGHRAAQMVELALAVATTSRPVAVLGDLNAEPRSQEMQILLGATALTDSAAAAGRPMPTIVRSSPYGDGAAGRDARIDYVLTRPGVHAGLQATAVERTFDTPFTLEGRVETFSDHRGVLAELTLGGPGCPLPAPTPEALATARGAIRRGERIAEQRQKMQRTRALSAGALALGSAAAARWTRRQWLRRAARGVAGLALLPATLWAGLAEAFTPSEFAGYRRVAERLATLERLTNARASSARDDHRAC